MGEGREKCYRKEPPRRTALFHWITPGFPGRCQRQKCAKAEEQQRDHRIQPKGIASLGRYDFSRVRLLGPGIGDNGMAPSRDVAGFVPFGNQFFYGVGFRLTELKRRFSLIGLEPFLHRRFESRIAGKPTGQLAGRGRRPIRQRPILVTFLGAKKGPVGLSWLLITQKRPAAMPQDVFHELCIILLRLSFLRFRFPCR